MGFTPLTAPELHMFHSVASAKRTWPRLLFAYFFLAIVLVIPAVLAVIAAVRFASRP